MKAPRHGLASTYKTGCRCTPCTEANDAFQAKFDGAHGLDGYERGCPCSQCWVAKTSVAAVGVHPLHGGDVWSAEESALVLREDLKVAEIARILGRSYRAVTARRYLERKKQAPVPD